MHACMYYVRAEGFVFPPTVTQAQLPAGVSLRRDLHPLTLWAYNASGGRRRAGNGDYFATSCALLEAAAAAEGYAPLLTIGYVYSRRPAHWLAATYEGALLRASRAFPLDYFWVWTQVRAS